MKKTAGILLSACAVLSLSLPVLAAAADTDVTSVAQEARASVMVEAVDVPNRLLTVRDNDGATRTVSVPESVKNLPQLKKGDKIVMRYTEAVATRILKPGEAGKALESTESTTTAPPGSTPGALTQAQTKAIIKVKSVDTAKNTLVFVGPTGATRTIAVKTPEMQNKLKQLKPGDEVEVVYTEAMAITVEPGK
jgi:NMD protein affecting ribosome stability and mRNA decay